MRGSKPGARSPAPGKAIPRRRGSAGGSSGSGFHSYRTGAPAQRNIMQQMKKAGLLRPSLLRGPPPGNAASERRTQRHIQLVTLDSAAERRAGDLNRGAKRRTAGLDRGAKRRAASLNRRAKRRIDGLDRGGRGCPLVAVSEFLLVQALRDLGRPGEIRRVLGAAHAEVREMVQEMAEHAIAVLGVLQCVQDVPVPKPVYVFAWCEGVVRMSGQQHQKALVLAFHPVSVLARPAVTFFAVH